ncbi:universal stress protein [Pollutibacter soli]|uniref:universal stress protein n=1 Tax=Pollutibacter soli TaxID=3034157 RepID=UPI003013B23C
MKKFLVPTDFSDTAKNAARYAVQLARDVKNASVVLYNVFDGVTTGEEGTDVYSDEDAKNNLAIATLKTQKAELESLGTGVDIAILAHEGDLIDNLEKLVHHQSIDLIIMGINGATKLEEIFIGSTTLSVINHRIAPVLVIPPDNVYREIDNVVFASDFKNVDDTTPVTELRKFLEMVKAKVHVVNVDVDHYVELTEEYQLEKAKLNKILDGFNPEYAFVRMYDFVDSINTFAQDRQADIIITVPRRHSFLEGLFKTSHTKKLAYHTHIPLLALSE